MKYNPNSEGLKNCLKFWDMSGKVPVAKFPVLCPSCRTEKTVPRWYRFHTRMGSESFYRCIVSYKCTVCSMIFNEKKSWIHGVVVTEEMFRKHDPNCKFGKSSVVNVNPRDL